MKSLLSAMHKLASRYPNVQFKKVSTCADHVGMSHPPISVKALIQAIDNYASVNINVILVGSDQFSQVELNEVNGAIERTRTIYNSIGLFVNDVQWYGIAIADANGRENIDSDGEAASLTEEWTVQNHALDVFFVKTYVGDTVGLSRVDGPCDKDSQGMTGSVVAIEESNDITGLVMAHEACHYLGPSHINDSSNLMDRYVPNDGNLTVAQGNDMKDHCFVNK